MTARRMDELPDLGAFQSIVRRLDPRDTLLRAWRLTGGVSAEITALEVARPDGSRRTLLARRYGVVDLAQKPHVAQHEFQLLQIVRAGGVPAPEPYAVDETGTLLPSPYIVVEFIEGETILEPDDLTSYVAQLAEHLARIHRVATRAGLAFLPTYGKGFGERPAVLDQTLHEAQIRDALEAAWPLTNQSPPGLLHGDYWPGNVLWRDGRLVGVIDWEDAAVGDPLADLGNCRLELLWANGADAMHAFTARYRELTGSDITNLPYWDLCAALRPCAKLGQWGLDAATEGRFRERHAWFVAQARAALAATDGREGR
jgi:aminoglycoside phosphotransferase (APT) family kinase protein